MTDWITATVWKGERRAVIKAAFFVFVKKTSKIYFAFIHLNVIIKKTKTPQSINLVGFLMFFRNQFRIKKIYSL